MIGSRQKAGELPGIRPGSTQRGKGRVFLMRLLGFFGGFIRDIFVASFLTYMVLLVLDEVKRGFASSFFNLDILLWLVVTTGVLTSLTGGLSRAAGRGRQETFSALAMVVFVVGMGLLGSFFIYAATTASGWKAVASSVAGGCATAVLALLFAPSLSREQDERR
jgi:hypothetical protein